MKGDPLCIRLFNVERRRHQRFALQQLVELGFGRERFIHAEGINISESGIRCRTNEELDVSTTVTVYFTLEADEENPETLRAEAVVMRCEPLDEEVFDVGMEFSMLSPWTDKRLVAYFTQPRESES